MNPQPLRASSIGEDYETSSRVATGKFRRPEIDYIMRNYVILNSCCVANFDSFDWTSYSGNRTCYFFYLTTILTTMI